MTILATTPDYATVGNFGGTDVCLYNNLAIAIATAGTVSNIAVYLPATAWDVSATTIKLRLYRESDGTFVTGGEVTLTSADGVGTVLKAITPFAASLAEEFRLLFVSDGIAPMFLDNGNTFETLQPVGTYAAPPTTLVPGSDAEATRAKFKWALDGTEGGGSVVNTEVLTDTLTPSDSATRWAVRGNVSTDNITLADALSRWWYRTRVLTDSLVITEGATETSTVSNVHAIDEITVSDGIVAWLRRTRLAQDAIAITDEAIASTIGYLIFVSVLTSQLTITDQALTTRYFSRLLESGALTSDQALRALLVTRNLLDTIDVDDQGLTALQRFILLTDAISLDDSLASVVVTPTVPGVTNPRILIGFDQPRIELGGYGF